MTPNANPLNQYFRQPAIHLRLPSAGKFWPEEAIRRTATNELPVYPMTAIDEITYRTPDALFNGQAVVSVIQSCCPAIQDAWQTPSVDINSLLVAIRLASYGHDMEINTTCPACSNEDEYSLDLRTVLDQQVCPDYDQNLQMGDLEIVFKPMTYQEQNQTNALQFEEQRILNMLPNSDIDPEVKLNKLNEVLRKITEVTVDALTYNIQTVRTPTAIVSEPAHIREFLLNCDRRMFNAVRDRVIELREYSDLKPVAIKCNNCDNQYQQPLTLDMASFFEHAS
jgi:hypothetical protein